MSRNAAPPPPPQAELRTNWRLDVGEYPTVLALSPDGMSLAVGTGVGELVLVHVPSGRVQTRALVHPEGIFGLAWSPLGEWLASAGADGLARIHAREADGLSCVATIDPAPGASKQWVEHLAWSPDGALLVLTAGRVARVWAPEHGLVGETPAHPSTITGVAWRAGGRELATSCNGGVHLWPVDEHGIIGPTIRALEWAGSLISLAQSPNERVIACATQEATVHFWRLPSGEDAQMHGFASKVKALAWDPQSTILATAGDATIGLWTFSGRGPEGKPPKQLACHKGLVTALAFGPKGLLASGARDGGVIIWRARSSSKPQRYALLDDSITALLWHPGGGLLASDEAGELRYWAEL